MAIDREYTPHEDRTYLEEIYESIAYHLTTVTVKNAEGTAQNIRDAFTGINLVFGTEQTKRYAEAVGTGTAPALTFYHTARQPDTDRTYGRGKARGYMFVVEAYAGDNRKTHIDLEEWLMLAFAGNKEISLYSGLPSSATEVGKIKFRDTRCSPQPEVTEAAGEEGHTQLTTTVEVRVFQSDN